MRVMSARGPPPRGRRCIVLASRPGRRDPHDLASTAPSAGSARSSCRRLTRRLAERLRVAHEGHHELARRLVVDSRGLPTCSSCRVDDGDLVGDLHRLSWSCVTKTVVTCTTSWSWRNHCGAGADARVEGAEGLVKSSTAARCERARAPPLPLPRRAVRGSGAKSSGAGRVEGSSAVRRSGLRPLAHLQAERDVVPPSCA